LSKIAPDDTISALNALYACEALTTHWSLGVQNRLQGQAIFILNDELGEVAIEARTHAAAIAERVGQLSVEILAGPGRFQSIASVALFPVPDGSNIGEISATPWPNARRDRPLWCPSRADPAPQRSKPKNSLSTSLRTTSPARPMPKPSPLEPVDRARPGASLEDHRPADLDREYVLFASYLPLARYRSTSTFVRLIPRIRRQLNSATGCLGYALRAEPKCAATGPSPPGKMRPACWPSLTRIRTTMSCPRFGHTFPPDTRSPGGGDPGASSLCPSTRLGSA
jgi:hypothetical protein